MAQNQRHTESADFTPPQRTGRPHETVPATHFRKPRIGPGGGSGSGFTIYKLARTQRGEDHE